MLEYYYSIKIDDIIFENNIYHFEYKSDYYYLLSYLKGKDSINKTIDIINNLKNNNIRCHEIIINNFNDVLSKIDEVDYILIKVINKNEIYSIDAMLEFNKKSNIFLNGNPKYDWAKLWSIKIDYIENQLSEIRSNDIIKSVVDYYIGLSENAIYYVNVINEKYNEKDRAILQRKRIMYPNYGLNYLNPINFIFDYEVRDIAEYLKSMFFESREDALAELDYYLESHKLTNYLYNMLFARLLYPSYFFDEYEKIINQKSGEKSLLKITNRISEYELFLKKALIKNIP